MLELRKDIFADERDDNLKEIGKPTQRQDMIGHVTGNTAYFDDHKLAGMLHLKVLRSPHHHARIRRIDTSEAERSGGRAPRHPRRRRAAQSQHAAEPVELRQGRRAVACDRQGPLQGRADRRDRGEHRTRGVRGAHQSARRLRAAYAGVRRRGGAQARRAGGERDLSEEHVRVSRQVRSPEAALRRRRAGLRAGRSRAGAALPDVADRACADRDQRLDRRTGGEQPLRGLHLRAGPVLLARHHGEDPRRAVEQAALHRRHGRRRLRRQGRLADRAARDARRDAHRAPGALRARPRGGDAVRLAARRRTHLRQGRRDEGRARHGAPGAQLFRQRRLHAAVELCGDQMRGAHSGAVHDPERACRHLLRLHQPRARDRDARLRRHGGRFRDRMPDGQARASHRHGPDGVPHPQRLSRRRHEGAPARGEEHRADRMRAGRGREGEVADPRRVQADVVARRRRRCARRDPAHQARRRPAGARARRTAAHELRPAAASACRAAAARTSRRVRAAASDCAAPLPHRPLPRRPNVQHGAARFSSVFGTRRR